MTRFRLRFSIRTLAIFVTLVCCYAACWGPTKRWGERDVFIKTFGDVEAIAPLVVAAVEAEWWESNVTVVPVAPVRRYYFWFFGYVAKLPFEQKVRLPSANFLPGPSPALP